MEPYLSAYSIWPSAACTAILLLFVATPLFAPADTPPSDGHRRVVTMDGLRGFLALAVVFHHAAMYHRYLADGVWEQSPSHFYSALGPLGVSGFFMVTGFLFWRRAIRAQANNKWAQFFIGRIFRIGPLYLAAAMIVLATVAVQSHAALHTSGPALVQQILRWLALGALKVEDVNGYDANLLLCGVTWSILYEWRFYVALPFLALACKRGRHLEFALVCLGTLFVIPHLLPAHIPTPKGLNLLPLFALGMLCASVQAKMPPLRLPDWLSSMLAVALLSGFFLFSDPYSPGANLTVGLFFFLVVSGCSMFSILTLRAARRLGDISYGIYLLQGLVFAAVLRPAASRLFDRASALGHWTLLLGCLVILVFAAMLAHIAIERPGIALGKELSSRFQTGRVRARYTDRVPSEG